MRLDLSFSLLPRLLYFISISVVTSACIPNVKQVSSQPKVESQKRIVEQKPVSIADKQLQLAEAYFQQGKHLSPESDNAYIRYRAAQIFDPENKQAKAGLDAILLGQIDDVRALLARNKITAAGKRLNVLKALFPESTVLGRVQKDIDSVRQKLKEKRKLVVTPKKKVRSDKNRVYLDANKLRARSEEIVSQLEALAVRVQQAEHAILIYARSDSEGRWIYKQMRKATPGYRIRGDIRIGEPSIKMVSPFE